jgi:GNAT superfamily N-acetyltransferase
VVRLRHATRDEAAELSALALRSKAHWGYDDEFLEASRAELTVTPDEIDALRIVVSERDGGELAGFYGLGQDPPEADLAFMFVEPALIGEGVGRQLWEHAVVTARSLGFARISIQSDPHAEGFYLSMGAARVGSAPSLSIPDRLLPLLHFPLT